MVEMTGMDFERPILGLDKRIAELEQSARQSEVDLSAEIARLRERCRQKTVEVFENLTPWQRVQLARDPSRPESIDYLAACVEDFVEVHGDRHFGEDRAIVCGFGLLDSRRIAFIGQRRGRTTRERMQCNFGSPHPEGYRKALRIMKLAEKFRLPVVTLVNTPGAYPGIGAEERGQSSAIAINLLEMARLRVPIVSVVIGEGGSGGALGICIADRLGILQNAYFSVISPEGCAAILWRDATKAPQAAEALRLTPKDLLRMGVMDEIVPEPLGGAHRDPKGASALLKQTLVRWLDELSAVPTDRLIEARYDKYRKIGVYLSEAEGALSTSPLAVDAPFGVEDRRH